MKEHIIRAILYENGDAFWKDTEVNGMVNIKLNVHQKARQFIEVELGNFILNEGEAVLASFERKVDGEFNHINPSRLNKVDGSNNIYRMQIPTEVHNIPGEWGVQFYAVTSYNKITGTYENAIAFMVLYFIEGSSFLDEGLTVPSKENLQALYDAAIDAKASAQSSAETANAAKESAQASASTATTAETNAKAYSESALAYKQTAESAAAVALDSKNQVIAIKEEIDLLVSQIQENTSNIAKNTELLNAQGIAIKENETAIKNNSFEIAEVNRKANTAIAIAAANKLYTITPVEQAYTSRETACGENIIDGSLAAVTEIKGKTVSCKNLIPSPNEPLETTHYGVKFTFNKDGSVTLNGQNNKENNSYVNLIANKAPVNLRKGTYTFSCGIDGDIRLTIRTPYEYISLWNNEPVVFYNDVELIEMLLIVPDTNNTAFNNVTIYPMLNEGSTALPYQPYFTGLKHAYINSIKSTGRNLIPSTYAEMPEVSNGVAFTKNTDGSIRVKGLCTGSSFVPLATGLMLVPNSQYTLSGYQGDADGDSRLHIDWYGVVSYNDWGYSVTFNAPNTDKTATIYFHIAQGITYDITLYPMLNLGASKLSYEPYTEDIYQLPETLELGGWKDENKNWVAFDSFNPQTGELVKGTGEYSFMGNEAWYDLGDYDEWRKRYCTNELDSLAKDQEVLIGTHGFEEGTIYTSSGGGKTIFIVSKELFATLEQWTNYLKEQYTAGNPLTVAYKSATPTTETIANASKSYKVHNHGNETVNQGATDNSKFGAMPTITTEYFKLTEV